MLMNTILLYVYVVWKMKRSDVGPQMELNKMLITMKSPLTDDIHTRDIPVTYEQINAWEGGELIQNAMPNLSLDDREYIKTGVTPEEWKRFIGVNNEDNWGNDYD